jgi:uroporphyrinogen decarboxylase
MTKRERVLTAVNREEPDRVPLDFGGTLATTAVDRAYRNLCRYLGLPEEVEYANKVYLLARVPLAVVERLGVDVVQLHLKPPDKQGRECNSLPTQPRRTFTDGSFEDEWGVVWSKPERGHYYVSEAPFEQEATVAAVERHPWPDPDDPGRTRGLREEAAALRQQTDCAICMYVHGRVLSFGQFMRGFGNWLMDLKLNTAFVHALLERATDLQIRMNAHLLDAVGEYVDIVHVADDLGGQPGPLISLATYRELIKPYHARIFRALKESAPVKLMHHSCGSVAAYLGDLIDVGVDILNPVQVSAAQMDTAALKREFGRDLCFWGGVDTQKVLPFGTPDDVRAEVRRRISDLAPGGGYVLAAVHNIQNEVPPENVVAMLDAAREYGGYSKSSAMF